MLILGLKAMAEVFSDLFSFTPDCCSSPGDPDVACFSKYWGRGRSRRWEYKIYIDVFLYMMVFIIYDLNLPFSVTIFGNIYFEM